MLRFAVDPLTVMLWWAAVVVSGALMLWALARLWRDELPRSVGIRTGIAMIWAWPVMWLALDRVFWLLNDQRLGSQRILVQWGLLASAAALLLFLIWQARSNLLLGRGLAVAVAVVIGLGLTWRCLEFSQSLRAPLAWDAAEREFLYDHFPQGAIERAPHDERYNCHDFTFFGGPTNRWNGRTVEQVLAERGYRRVDTPRIDDVIVYRDLKGMITHTGIVRAIGSDGTVLIESKWGALGRFLHPPDVHNLRTRFEYYSNASE